MIIDNDDSQYWFACYTDNKKCNFGMARTSPGTKMVDMMQHFIKNQPNMSFTPTQMYLGRALDNKQGRQWFDDEEYQPFLAAFLANDKKVLVDVCITQMVKVESQAEFNAYKKLYPHGRTFDQLDNLIKSSKKKK